MKENEQWKRFLKAVSIKPEEELARTSEGQKRNRGKGEERGERAIGDLVEKLVTKARLNQASDIHFEPFADCLRIRMRRDGFLQEEARLDPSLHSVLLARIKILAGMDIAEHRIPQDGHFSMRIKGEKVDMRVSTVPAVFGEKTVIRLLPGKPQIDDQDTFGMGAEKAETLKEMLDGPGGLIYFTGPTGSGKTTTLYLILEYLAARPINIATIEDPVERFLEGISQCQVNEQTGMTFETGLRALLRQDPDVIMVGETRDFETGETSVRGAITGHLVLSTLHTKDAASAILRLKDMGIEPYLAAAALRGVVAQRLVRKLCPLCAGEKKAEDEEKRILGEEIKIIRKPVGCQACRYTGYQGRRAIHEVMKIDGQIREMIAAGARAEEIREYAAGRQGMETLKENARRLVLEGVTSLEEYKRAVYYDD